MGLNVGDVVFYGVVLLIARIEAPKGHGII
jgi:hypothetical protein